MPIIPESISSLIGALSQLPGIGPRSAERIALYLAQSEPATVKRLADALMHARERVRFCESCGGLAETQLCETCSDPRRDPTLVCVVERPVDILSIEKSGVFRGKYHVLGGKISPLDGIEPEDLRIAALERRLGQEPIREVILALGTDVEGDATSFYLSRRLNREGLKVTRLAHGLPAGTGLEFADEVTLGHALSGRREL